MLLIISTFGLFYSTLQFTYCTFDYISFSHSVIFSVDITPHLFESWHDGAAHVLLILFPPAQWAEDHVFSSMILMTITVWYRTMTMIVAITIQNQNTSLYYDHPRKQWASGHQMFPPRQHLVHESWQLNQFLQQQNPYILIVGRYILSRRRRIKASLSRWDLRKYWIKCANDGIRPRMNKFTGEMIEVRAVSNWSHGKMEIWGDMSPLLKTWQASSSVQNALHTELSQVLQPWSWHMRSL